MKLCVSREGCAKEMGQAEAGPEAQHKCFKLVVAMSSFSFCGPLLKTRGVLQSQGPMHPWVSGRQSCQRGDSEESTASGFPRGRRCQS